MSCFNNLYAGCSVDIMASKLDEENLGIITLNSFMEEFYAGEATQDIPKSFTLYHYNGLARSCQENKVRDQDS